MKLAYSYIRFSTPEQLKGDSLRRQLELSEKYCAAHGLTLDQTLRMRDLGISAFRSKNKRKGSLGNFLQLVEDGRIEPGSVLIVESFDRLSRDEITEQVPMFMQIINSGIKLVTLMDGREYTKASVDANPTDLIVSITVMMRAHEESKTKSERLKASYIARRRKLKAGEHAPMGRCPRFMKPIGGKFVLIPERVRAIRKMIAMAMDGHGSNTIAATLNREGYPAWGKHARTVKALWDAPTIKHIINSRVLIGEYTPKQTINGRKTAVADAVPNYYPAVMTEKEFYQLQSILDTRRMSAGRGRSSDRVTNLFGDLLVSGHDGSRMNIVQSIESQGKHKVTMVSQHAMRGTSVRVGFSYRSFETHFLKWVREVTLKPQKQQRGIIQELQGRKAEIEGKIQKLNASLLSSGNFDAGIELLKNLDGQRKSVLDEIENAKRDQHQQHVTTDDIAALFDKMDAAKTDERFEIRTRLKLAIAEVVQKVRVYIYARKNRVRICIALAILRDGTCRAILIVTPHGKAAQSREIEHFHIDEPEQVDNLRFDVLAEKIMDATA